MLSMLDRIVVFDGNKDAFTVIKDITAKHEKPVQAVICGPEGSGKTAMLQARARDKDMLSTRRVISCNAQEIQAALEIGVNEGFLDEVGGADVLMIDDFGKFIKTEMGAKIAMLLLSERNNHNLDTLVVVEDPLTDEEMQSIGDVIAKYPILEVKPLGPQERVQMGRLQEKVVTGESDNFPKISDEAMAYIVNDFVPNLNEVQYALRYLLTEAGFEPGYVITKKDAEDRLK